MTRNVTGPIGGALTAIAALAGDFAAAQPVPTYSLESISRVPTARLATQLLPADAADVESHEVVDGGMMRWLSGIRFFHRPQPTGADLCVRRHDYVGFIAMPEQADRPPEQIVAQPGPVVSGTQIALAPGCRLEPGHEFAYFNPPVSQHDAANALRAVAAARTAARGTGDLSFSFTCADELGQGACGGDGRAALAGLRMEQAWMIAPVPGHADQVRVIVGEPGQLYWELRLAVGAVAPADLAMTRKVPAPF